MHRRRIDKRHLTHTDDTYRVFLARDVQHDFVETAVVPLSEKKYGKHPTQKPLGLLSHFIRLLSNEGDVVFDPFMGSGSTGVAALNLKRRFVGIELSHDYFAMAERRIKAS